MCLTRSAARRVPGGGAIRDTDAGVGVEPRQSVLRVENPERSVPGGDVGRKARAEGPDDSLRREVDPRNRLIARSASTPTRPRTMLKGLLPTGMGADVAAAAPSFTTAFP